VRRVGSRARCLAHTRCARSIHTVAHALRARRGCCARVVTRCCRLRCVCNRVACEGEFACASSLCARVMTSRVRQAVVMACDGVWDVLDRDAVARLVLAACDANVAGDVCEALRVVARRTHGTVVRVCRCKRCRVVERADARDACRRIRRCRRHARCETQHRIGDKEIVGGGGGRVEWRARYTAMQRCCEVAVCACRVDRL
jgi:hypothetical protein